MVLGVTLEYATPSPPEDHRLLRFITSVLILYPFALAAVFYGHWLAVTLVLGHPPRPMFDDTRYPGQPLVWTLLGFMILGAFPVASASLALNLVVVSIDHRVRALRCAIRLGLTIIPWLALLALAEWDPGSAWEWLFD